MTKNLKAIRSYHKLLEKYATLALKSNNHKSVQGSQIKFHTKSQRRL